LQNVCFKQIIYKHDTHSKVGAVAIWQPPYMPYMQLVLAICGPEIHKILGECTGPFTV